MNEDGGFHVSAVTAENNARVVDSVDAASASVRCVAVLQG